MNWIGILLRSPIDRLTKLVTSQRRVSQREEPLTRDELLLILERAGRKQRLLKHVLRINNPRQHSNFMQRWKRGFRQFRVEAEPRAAMEYIRLGEMMQRYIGELAALKQQRKKASADFDLLHPRVPALMVTTHKTSGLINAFRIDARWSTLSEAKKFANADGRVFEYFALTQTQEFLACAERHGQADAARECLAGLEGS